MLFRSHLIPVGQVNRLTKKLTAEITPAVSWQSPDKNTGESHARKITAVTTIAKRLEAQLQNRYIEYLIQKGHEYGTFKITIPESNAPLSIDLVDKTEQKIIEVKAGSTRGYVRQAIGQVLDYVFQLKRIKNEVWKPAILLPGKPSDDLIELINSLNIELIYESDKGFH